MPDGGGIEQRLRALTGVVACEVSGAGVHLLVERGRDPRRVAIAAAAVVAPPTRVHVLSADRRVLGGAKGAASDIVPVFAAVLAATLVAGAGSAVLAEALDGGRVGPGAGVIAVPAAADPGVRTVQPAPERTEVLGEVLEAPVP